VIIFRTATTIRICACATIAPRKVPATAEVKVLAKELTKVFESKGVHREALGALKLFKEAAEQEAAMAELARRVLGYLFRARYDEGLRFTGP
jgi:hypothetical protein